MREMPADAFLLSRLGVNGSTFHRRVEGKYVFAPGLEGIVG
jgi:hypothetical protein